MGKITIEIENILEAAKKNGLNISKGERTGLYIGNDKVGINELFTDIYEELSIEDQIALSIDVTVNKEKSKINFKDVTTSFVNDRLGAA